MNKTLESNEKEILLNTLKKRFLKHMHRHENSSWDNVLSYLKDDMLWIIKQMDDTGGEPDVVKLDDKLLYVDMSIETPKQRVSVCYDEEARLSRKKFPPLTSAMKMTEKMGIRLLDENMYKALQALEPFDLKTSSWLLAPKELRLLGGALFGDRRYNRTFIYHNGADSYYGSRGFRGYIQIG